MKKWIFPCNIKQFDVFAAFDALPELEWSQGRVNVEVGDLVFIYLGSPVQEIRYLCVVTATDLADDDCVIDDSAFSKVRGEVSDSGRYMRIKLIKGYTDGSIPFALMQELGIKGSMQGARLMTDELEEYIDGLGEDSIDTNVINRELLEKYAHAYVYYEIALHGVDPRKTLDGTMMRIEDIEGYKYGVYEKNREKLDQGGPYTEIIMNALPGGNLVDYHQKLRIQDYLEANGSADLEEALEFLYEGDDDSLAFRMIVDALGGNYDVLGFLFFLKDCEKYLPIRPRRFDEKFALLGLKSDLEGNCTWESYKQFIEWISEIKEFLTRNINESTTLLDAHSFVWMLSELEAYMVEGIRVIEHKADGLGIVLHDDGKTITCRFGKKTKQFDKGIVTENNLVEYVSVELGDENDESIVGVSSDLNADIGSEEDIADASAEKQSSIEQLPEYDQIEMESIDQIIQDNDEKEKPEWSGKKAKQEMTTSSQTGREIPKRDPQRAADALRYANYLCEYDNEDRTFLRKNGKPYTEPHHLIPISKYRDFEYSVDVMENIVSLCSHCHNLLHYGRLEDKKPILEKLYEERKDALKNCGLVITLEELEGYYK